jgi:hypothetical protein
MTPTLTPEKPAAAPAPAGYMQDGAGRLVPLETIKPIDLERDKLVLELVAHAKALSQQIRAFKTQAFGDIDAFCDLSAEMYGVKRGGNKGNVCLFSFDQKYKVLRAIAEYISFDERLQTAKVLVDECIHEWAADSRPELQALINQAFQVDKAGKINTGRVLALRRLEIDDPRWQLAMKAISEAVQVIGSKTYVRVFERISSGEYVPIALDVATA